MVRARGTRAGFRRDERGATAVEFGLLAVPFLAMLCATFDVGLAALIERNLDEAAQYAARQVRTGAAQGAGVTTPAAFVAKYVCPPSGSVLGSFVTCANIIVDIRTSTSFTGNDLSSGFYKTPTTNEFCLGSPSEITIVRIAYPMPWWIPVVGPGGAAQTLGLVNDVPNNPGWKLLLVAASAIRAEPYPSGQYATYQAAKGC